MYDVKANMVEKKPMQAKCIEKLQRQWDNWEKSSEKLNSWRDRELAATSFIQQRWTLVGGAQ